MQCKMGNAARASVSILHFAMQNGLTALHLKKSPCVILSRISRKVTSSEVKTAFFKEWRSLDLGRGRKYYDPQFIFICTSSTFIAPFFDLSRRIRTFAKHLHSRLILNGMGVHLSSIVF